MPGDLHTYRDPERRFKPGMDGGLTAAVLVTPPLYLRTDEILSKQWGPPQAALAWTEAIAEINHHHVSDELYRTPAL